MVADTNVWGEILVYEERIKDKIKGYIRGKEYKVFNDEECAFYVSLTISCDYCKFNGKEFCVSCMLPNYVK